MVADNQRGWHQSKQLIACVYRKSEFGNTGGEVHRELAVK